MDISQNEKDRHSLLHASSRRAKEVALKKVGGDVEEEHAPKGEEDAEVLVAKVLPSNPDAEGVTPEVRHSEATPSKTVPETTPSKTDGEVIPSNAALEASPSNAVLDATVEVSQAEAKSANDAGEGTSNADREAKHPIDDGEGTSSPNGEAIPSDTANVLLKKVLGDDLGEESDHPAPKKKRRIRKVPKEDCREANKVDKSGPFPGGPRDNVLLRTFYDHIALKIWLGEERKPLRCLNHTTCLHEWKIDRYIHNSRFMDKVTDIGLHVLSHALTQTNKSLISALVERWHPETSSFHLPFGEMTITLDDVKQITGLPIEGEMLRSVVIEDTEKGVDLVNRTLGIDPVDIRKEFKFNADQLCVRLSWLRQMLGGIDLVEVEDSGNEGDGVSEGDRRMETIDFVVRGYILYSLGCNLFADKTSSRVSIGYLKFLENVNDAKKYAWGVSGLAFLYKALTDASRHNVAQIMGYLSLLEVWVYEHIIPLKGSLFYTYCEPHPRMRRWLKCGGVPNADTTMISIRQTLDTLGIHDVIWDPYKEERTSSRKLDEICFYEGLITSVGAAAPYMPSRVLRQFGLLQDIPNNPPNACVDNFAQWVNHVVDPSNRVQLIDGQSDFVDGYIDWYIPNSHPKVQNPGKWVGPATGARSVTLAHVAYRIFHAKTAEGMVATILGKGKRYSGRAYGDLQKVLEELEKCNPPPQLDQEEEVEEEREETEEQKRKPRKRTPKNNPRKRKRNTSRKATGDEEKYEDEDKEEKDEHPTIKRNRGKKKKKNVCELIQEMHEDTESPDEDKEEKEEHPTIKKNRGKKKKKVRELIQEMHEDTESPDIPASPQITQRMLRAKNRGGDLKRPRTKHASVYEKRSRELNN